MATNAGIRADPKAGTEHVETWEDDPVKKDIELADTKVDQFGARTKTDPQEIALVKKMDRYILPILWLMYFLNFLDRNAMINGKLNGLDDDLGLVGSQYNTCVSILFVGYLAGQIPSNMILSRVRPSWYMSGFMLAWSITTTLTYMAHDYKSMVGCRFVLGLVEAPFYPGALYMLSMFYTRKEIAARMAVFYTGNMAASAFSGLISAGIFAKLDGRKGLAGWQWLFIIQGAVSILVSIMGFFMLPDSPLQTRWLNAEQRELAHRRIIEDSTERRQGPDGEKISMWTGLREATSDWRCWVFALMDNLHLSANGFKNFLPSVTATLTDDTTLALVLTCPPYVVAGITSILVSWSSGRFNERTWHTTLSKAVAIVGFVLSCATLNVPARYIGIMLFVGATYGVNNIILGWCSAVLGQTDEKKAVAIAICNTFGNLASVYTPYLWPDSAAPRYVSAMMASTGFSIGVVLCAWVMKIALMRQNKKMRASGADVSNFYVY